MDIVRLWCVRLDKTDYGWVIPRPASIKIILLVRVRVGHGKVIPALNENRVIIVIGWDVSKINWTTAGL